MRYPLVREICNGQSKILQCWCKLFDFLGAFEILVFLTAIEHALDAFGFAAAEVRFADVRPHHFTACGEFEPLGGGFVSFDFGHAIYSLSISDFRFWIPE